jgi:hypothetical protein
LALRLVQVTLSTQPDSLSFQYCIHNRQAGSNNILIQRLINDNWPVGALTHDFCYRGGAGCLT